MAFCTNCGSEIKDNIKFCTACGTPFTGEESAETQQPEIRASVQTTPVVQPVPVQQTVYQGEYVPGADSKYQPISTWGYIGIMLLMCIPIVGFVLIIVWALGGCRKVNKRNFARASLILCAIGLIFSLIVGFAIKSAISNALDESGLSSLFDDSEEESGGLAALLGQDFSADDEDSYDYNYDDNSVTYENQSGLDGDMGDLGELAQALAILEGLSGVSSDSNGGNNIGDLLEGIEAANEEAEAINNGWPSDLRPYPGGAGNELTSYRTEFAGTTLEEMTGYINDLKSDGYVFQDFYDFGMSEDDMLGMGAWWGTNGKYYLSLSYVEGTVTIDHTTELPDLGNLF